jgi:hypothetical protein
MPPFEFEEGRVATPGIFCRKPQELGQTPRRVRLTIVIFERSGTGPGFRPVPPHIWQGRG